MIHKTWYNLQKNNASKNYIEQKIKMKTK